MGKTSVYPAYAILKYPNRRLYSLRESKYIGLIDVDEMVRSHVPVLVLDKKTGADLTAKTLAQVVTLRYESEADTDLRPMTVEQLLHVLTCTLPHVISCQPVEIVSAKRPTKVLAR